MLAQRLVAFALEDQFAFRAGVRVVVAVVEGARFGVPHRVEMVDQLLLDGGQVRRDLVAAQHLRGADQRPRFAHQVAARSGA
jgi:predicted methyltransferase MtxX (methanogen marker protein 4)